MYFRIYYIGVRIEMDSFDFDPDPLGDDCLKHRGDINMLFYVVFMNDSPEFVSPNEEKAKQKLA